MYKKFEFINISKLLIIINYILNNTSIKIKMYWKNIKKSYSYTYLIIFLIYIKNMVKYYFNYESNSKINKIHSLSNNNYIFDEEYGYVDTKCVFVDNDKNYIKQYQCDKSKIKQD